MILLEKGHAPQEGAGAHSQPTAWGGGWREGRGRLAPHRRQLNRDEDHCSRGSALSRDRGRRLDHGPQGGSDYSDELLLVSRAAANMGITDILYRLS